MIGVRSNAGHCPRLPFHAAAASIGDTRFRTIRKRGPQPVQHVGERAQLNAENRGRFGESFLAEARGTIDTLAAGGDLPNMAAGARVVSPPPAGVAPSLERGSEWFGVVMRPGASVLAASTSAAATLATPGT